MRRDLHAHTDAWRVQPRMTLHAVPLQVLVHWVEECNLLQIDWQNGIESNGHDWNREAFVDPYVRGVTARLSEVRLAGCGGWWLWMQVMAAAVADTSLWRHPALLICAVFLDLNNRSTRLYHIMLHYTYIYIYILI